MESQTHNRRKTGSAQTLCLLVASLHTMVQASPLDPRCSAVIRSKRDDLGGGVDDGKDTPSNYTKEIQSERWVVLAVRSSTVAYY